MRFKVDEIPSKLPSCCAPPDTTPSPCSISNSAAAPIAPSATRSAMRSDPLLTLDLDFADIRAFPPGEYSGLIVLRLSVQAKPSVLAVIGRMIPLLNTEPLIGMLWVVDETALRIRGETS